MARSKTAALVEIPIIAYHSLDDSGSVISTSPALFRHQVGILLERGFAAITLSEASAHLEGGGALVPKPIAITFDDGFRSVAEHAAPVLHEAGFRATMFAVAGRVGTDNDWPGQPAWVPRQPLLSFGELDELAGAGWEIGSHTLEHPDLSRVDANRARDEVVRSKQLLEDGLGREVSAFAYPYGLANPRVRRLVASCYRVACSGRLGHARPEHDRFWLPRIDAYYLRNPAFVGLLATPAGRCYFALRSLGRRARRLVPGTY